MRNSIILLVVLLSSIYTITYAGKLAKKANVYLTEDLPDEVGAASKLKSGTKAVLKHVPGGGLFSSLLDSVTGGDLEEKVDRIDKRQKTSLDRIREIAHEALETKKKVEEMYYFKKRSQQEAEFLSRGLKKGSIKKFLGAIIEDGLKIPINPAEYVPSIPRTKKLKENLDLDLSLEKSVISQGKYLVSYTRSFLLSSNLIRTNPKQFDKEYKEAEEYEEDVQQALKAKQVASAKIYKAEIERLEKELKLLEETKRKQGLTVGDVMQIEMAIDSKRRDIRELNEKIDASIKADLALSEEDKFKMGAYTANKDGDDISSFMEKDKKRIRAKYSHLWDF